ncbi:MAG: Rpp14/Pop5 family protein, partial [Candidatus Methanoperedens sp.]|nr:Rpp14/Pop5 family protein [Candidatus Methanoperedens sp.]
INSGTAMAITRQELVREISNSIISLFGDKGASEINPSLMSFEGRYGILRCNREKTNETRAALACINNIHGIPVSIYILGISGTIKGATEKFIQQSLLKESEPEKRIKK